MAIKKSSGKYDHIVSELDEHEKQAQEKSNDVVKSIVGKNSKTKTIIDKNGKSRELKIVEDRKRVSVYLPVSLYEQFDELTSYMGISNNAAICQLIREYLIRNKEVLKDI